LIVVASRHAGDPGSPGQAGPGHGEAKRRGDGEEVRLRGRLLQGYGLLVAEAQTTALVTLRRALFLKYGQGSKQNILSFFSLLSLFVLLNKKKRVYCDTATVLDTIRHAHAENVSIHYTAEMYSIVRCAMLCSLYLIEFSELRNERNTSKTFDSSLQIYTGVKIISLLLSDSYLSSFTRNISGTEMVS
jgi:hypothetical protein